MSQGSPSETLEGNLGSLTFLQECPRARLCVARGVVPLERD